ncbi:adenosylcobinamide-GDP ribazoletransferase [Corynebacterium xerosis]|uniref:Adenosylcobinamide-GDP ribazoletransferase n=1 Tax=Corynebacterium xerosis TaxID=1725 RepID=A0A6B8TE04_9CORY|nr:adenosylcobinamide-GDP ribazoletransferase [Corynebacterium xerosis]QGS33724.1 adenosylcobinamide-GDP ribazoletransferase [Corynebacterium xerosis]
MSGKAGPSEGASLDGDRAAHGNGIAEGIGTAISWLTIVPMRGAKVFDRITGRRALTAAPVAGLVPGLAAVIVAVIVAGGAHLLSDGRGPTTSAATAISTAADAGVSPATAPLLAALIGVLIVCASELTTRAMHIDGLADVADALGSYRDPAGAREVLRSPDIGPMGSAAVTLALVGQAAAMAVLAHGFTTTLFPTEAAAPSEGGTADIVTAALELALPFVIARAAATTACHHSFPPMSPTGFGGLVGATQPSWAVVAWWLPLTVAAWFLAGAAGILACLVVVLFTVLFARKLVTRLGGINGDGLGAIVQLSTLISAVFLALG